MCVDMRGYIKIYRGYMGIYRDIRNQNVQNFRVHADT